MKTFARLTLVGCFALFGSAAALASGDCGMNSNKPCPPPEKLNSKEPAYKSMNSNTPVARRADDDDASAAADVQATEADEAEAKATLTGVSASDLKMPPAKPCGLNSNKPCAEQGEAAATASDVKLDAEPAKPRRKKPVE